MKLLISLASLIMVVIISCGGSSSSGDGLSWDGYRSQIDTWQEQVDEKLAQAHGLLEAGSANNPEVRSSLQALGIEMDSITLAVRTLHPPAELQEFHDSFVLATDFYKLAGRLLFEFSGDSEADRAAIVDQLTNEIAFGEANMRTAQSIFNEAAQKR